MILYFIERNCIVVFCGLSMYIIILKTFVDGRGDTFITFSAFRRKQGLAGIVYKMNCVSRKYQEKGFNVLYKRASNKNPLTSFVFFAL